jgi:hypothetical protein
MGCRKPGLRVVGYEIGSKDRCVLSYMSSESLTQYQQSVHSQSSLGVVDWRKCLHEISSQSSYRPSGVKQFCKNPQLNGRHYRMRLSLPFVEIMSP